MSDQIHTIAILKKAEYIGFSIQPYIYSSNNKHYISPTERITSLNVNAYPQLDYPTKELFSLSNLLEPSVIVAHFSKKKLTPKEFFDRNAKLFSEVIKPFIDRKLSEIIDILIKEDIHLYDAAGLPNLYDTDRIFIEKKKAQTLLKFNRTEQAIFYTLEARIDKTKIKLQQEGNIILTNEPCHIVTEKRIISFEKNITGKLISPFLSKPQLEIPKRFEKTYFETFIKKILNTSDITAEGFSVINTEPQPFAVLSYQIDWQGKKCIVVKFRYGEKTILANNSQKTLTELRAENEGFVFYRAKRNKNWELKKLDFIKSLGLTHYESCFRIEKSSDQSNPYALLDFLVKHRILLLNEGFEIEQETETIYNLNEPVVTREINVQNDWFDVNIQISIGSFIIPFNKLRRNILSGNREYVLPDGSLFIIPVEWLEYYRDLMIHAVEKSNSLLLKKHHFRIMQDLEVPVDLPDASDSMVHGNIHTEVPQLNDVTLRPYQQAGFRWLKNITEMGFGAILADDMGLGKTLQTIALLTSFYNKKLPSEIIIPEIKKPNKAEQLDLFNQPAEDRIIKAKDHTNSAHNSSCSLLIMPASLIHNWQNEIERFAPMLRVFEYTGSLRRNSKNIFKKYDILITTYGTVRNDIELLRDNEFDYVIIDESQQIKNPASKTAQAVFQLKSKYRLALTGTPVENSLTDLWSQMNFINPGLLGSQSTFNSYYSTPLSNNPEGIQAEKLLKLISPFILRRTKVSVAPELPELIETVSYCTMSDEQSSLYESEKSKVRNLILDHLDKGLPTTTPVIVLKALMQLRQIANHPKMIDHSSVVESGKFEEVSEKLSTILSENHRVLVFSSFVKHLNIFADYCELNKMKYSLLTGSSINRGKIISQFRDNEDVKVFLISLKAGGVGLNLTEADYVFILDPWWNPAAEMQAINRAHRIGQDKNVFVYRFITKNTIEEKIMLLQKKKREIAEAFIKPQQAIAGMTREEIIQLFS